MNDNEKPSRSLKQTRWLYIWLSALIVTSLAGWSGCATSHGPTAPSPSPAPRFTPAPPVLLAPAHGASIESSQLELQWRDDPLPEGYYFVVRLRHTFGYTVASPALNVGRWRPSLPPGQGGWWEWMVEVVQDTNQGRLVVARSDEWSFWLQIKPTSTPATTSTPGPSPTPTMSLG